MGRLIWEYFFGGYVYTFEVGVSGASFEHHTYFSKMELSPNNIGMINGNVYKIEIKEFEDLVILEKINDN